MVALNLNMKMEEEKYNYIIAHIRKKSTFIFNKSRDLPYYSALWLHNVKIHTQGV